MVLLCQHEGCSIRPSFGFEFKKPLFCNEHKEDNMKNVKDNQKCRYEGCSKQPSFGFEFKKPLFCRIHKTEEMFDVINNLCQYTGCKKHPAFGFEFKKPLFCNDHKDPHMENVISKRCEYNGCNIQACFGLKLKKPIFCLTHKIEKMFDVTNKLCQYTNCTTRASFGIDKLLFCVAHKTEEMTNLINIQCKYPTCTTSPIFGLEYKKPLFCCNHKTEEMFDVRNKKCNYDWCYRRAKYNGYCVRCCVYLHPEIKICRNYKTKENDIVDRITKIFPEFSWVNDKKIDGGCSKKRPDLLLDLATHVLIIEIDENKHVNYECICENKRLMEISKDLNHRPIICIRFNPDSYTDQRGVKINSCWKYNNSTGILFVPTSNLKQWEKRIEILCNTIKYWITYQSEKTIEIVELFY